MLDINSVLDNYQSHLPAAWNRSQGLRALFPPGFSGSISHLKSYVVFVYSVLGTRGYGEDAQGDSYIGISCICHLWLGIDGQGHWFFAWIYGNSDRRGDPREAGFIFKFSPDDKGRGYVDRSHPQLLTLTCSAGVDQVISDNWPQMLGDGGRVLFQGPPSNLNSPDFWTTEGYAQLTFLNGGSVAPAPGSRSGSTLFPFSANIPADALAPQGVSLIGGSPPDGGIPDSTSYSIFDPEEDPYDALVSDIGGIGSDLPPPEN